MEDIEREILVMKQIDHPHVVRLFEWYEDSGKIYLVIEALHGGTLRSVMLDFHRQGRWLKEEWVRLVTQQVVQAMDYVHGLRLIHKDLKDENIMLLKKDPNFDEPFAVIIDLGITEMFSSSDPHGKVMGGTPVTMAPEVWLNNFGPKCDVFSVGCILYEMLTGSLPFEVQSFDPKDWLALHKYGPNWKQVKTSPFGKDLCQKMLTYKDKERPSMRECLQHQWFAVKTKSLLKVPPEQFQALKSFCKQSSLKKALLLEIAARLPMAQAKKIVQTFKAFDTNSDASLSLDELRAYFQQVGLHDEALLKKSFKALDSNHDGLLSFSEFAAAILPSFEDLMCDRLHALFLEYDRDGDGALMQDEVRGLLAKAMQKDSDSKKASNRLITKLFKSGNKKIKYRQLKESVLGSVMDDTLKNSTVAVEDVT